MNNKNRFTFILLTTGLLLTGACSHVPSVGDHMIEQSSNTKELGKKWNKGNTLVEKGNKNIAEGESMIKKGEKLINQGNATIQDGQKMIVEGGKMMEQSKLSYQHSLAKAAVEEMNEFVN